MLYYLSTHKMKRIIEEIIFEYGFKKCYDEGQESIFKTDDLMITKKKKYFSISPLSFESANVDKIRKRIMEMEGRKSRK